MELIKLVKLRKVKEVIKQIEEGANINELDENGCTVLHYACSSGLLDIIVAASQYGVNIEQQDKDGESALFKAVRNSKIESIVALVAFKSEINVVNKNGESPLQIAVEKKDISVIELLCSLGSLMTINDWAISGVDNSILTITDQRIMQTLINQKEMEADCNYGNHAFRVCYISDSTEEHLPLLTGIKLYMNNITNGFFIYCSKSIPEYTDFEMHLGLEDRIFSDVYEIKVWGVTPKYIRLNIAVLGVVKQNQEVLIVPFEGSVEGHTTGRAVLTPEDDDLAEEYTTIDVKIDLTGMKSAKFVVLAKLRKEEFGVSEESLKIVPQSESGAEINIPEGTFDSPGKLILNISQTNDWNTDEMIIFSNALNIKMQNNIKPKKEVIITLPLHSSEIQPDDLIVISSEKDVPETENDWEICSRNVNIQGNTVTFAVNHFTSFVPVLKTKIRQSTHALTKAVAQYRPTEVFAGIKKETDNKLSLVVEVSVKNLGKQRRKFWKKKGFRLQASEYSECTIKEGEKLKISVDGNFEIDSIRESGGEQLIFNPDKKSFRTFNVVSEGQESPIGYILVSRSTKKVVEYSLAETSKIKRKQGCFNAFFKNVVEVETPRKVTIETVTEELASLPIDEQLSYDIQGIHLDEDAVQEIVEDVRIYVDELNCEGDAKDNTGDFDFEKEKLQGDFDDRETTDDIVADSEDLEGDKEDSTEVVLDEKVLQNEGDDIYSTLDDDDDKDKFQNNDVDTNTQIRNAYERPKDIQGIHLDEDAIQEIVEDVIKYVDELNCEGDAKDNTEDFDFEKEKLQVRSSLSYFSDLIETEP